MTTKRYKARDVRFSINGVVFDEPFESFEWSAPPADPEDDRELAWAAWFERVWNHAGRRRDRTIAGMPIAAVRLGHRRIARGELEAFPRPAY